MHNFINAPHRGGAGVPEGAPNAALLIDFDNVTMGIRSDLTRQLKDLLNSDIIKGKVAVQRAYADWRRYAQYIVPLSEASVDLIFAPAYGSSKKNATDIRLAIDALELVFTRPEIGTYILLSGDSDFSSMVLKLKEYGKYVIGVGLRESASDLLVQNCDEYFSYSSLTGLTRAGEEDMVSETDPWELVQRAVEQMASQNDVMRSDRLKQVMLELDSNFDESELGFSKFNKFLTEAASRNRLALRKLENGQYEVQPYENGERESRGATEQRESRGSDERRRGRGRREQRGEAHARQPERTRESAPREQAPREQAPREQAPQEPTPREERREEPRVEARSPRSEAAKPKPRPSTHEGRAEDLQHGYDLLQNAIRQLVEQPDQPARDSDIKRQMLEIEPGWDESALGFTKFSRFLRQAHDVEVIDLQKSPDGYYEARLPKGAQKFESRKEGRGRGGRERTERTERTEGTEREQLATQATPAAEDRSRPEAETARDQAAREAEAAQRRDRAEAKAAETRQREGERERQAAEAARHAQEEQATEAAGRERQPVEREAGPAAEAPAAEAAPEETGKPEETGNAASADTAEANKPRTYGRRGRRRGGAQEGPPPLLPGQAVGAGASAGGGAAAQVAEESSPAMPSQEPAAKPAEAPEVGPESPAAGGGTPSGDGASSEREPAAAGAAAETSSEAAPAAAGGEDFDPAELGLPTDEGAVIRYLSNSYQGVGQKTAEALIRTFGAERVFNGLHAEPDRVREVLGSGRRTDGLLIAWQRDYRRRTSAEGASAGEPTGR